MKSALIRLMLRINSLIRKIAIFTHKVQHQLQWNDPRSSPEWYDHFLDQYYSWPSYGIPFWLERGVFNLLVLKKNGDALELCCGDGFNAKNFYAHRVKSLTSIDFDKDAITQAHKYNFHPKVKFLLGDIRSDIPKNQKFDNVLWDAAIEHFYEHEIKSVMSNLTNCLTENGILSGYTIVEKDDGGKHLHQHEYEFKSKEDLARFLFPWFKNVRVFETFYEQRHNLYFFASNGVLPFDSEWTQQILKNEISQ